MSGRFRLDVAAAWLRVGGVVAYPTEAVYGVGCLPLDEQAVARVIAIKGRRAAKGLIVIAAELDQIAELVQLPSDPQLADQVVSSWPGPVTWVLPARPGVRGLLTGGRDTLAVRVTAHPQARELCRRADSALVSTSANRAGRPPARSALAVRRRLGSQVDFVYAGRLGDAPNPTTIRDGRSGQVLRSG
jgi:L-threonylcarbamoyladenylate synthase